jgi:hypothetical protein
MVFAAFEREIREFSVKMRNYSGGENLNFQFALLLLLRWINNKIIIYLYPNGKDLVRRIL